MRKKKKVYISSNSNQETIFYKCFLWNIWLSQSISEIAGYFINQISENNSRQCSSCYNAKEIINKYIKV